MLCPVQAPLPKALGILCEILTTKWVSKDAIIAFHYIA